MYSRRNKKNKNLYSFTVVWAGGPAPLPGWPADQALWSHLRWSSISHMHAITIGCEVVYSIRSQAGERNTDTKSAAHAVTVRREI
jgi:hypothetical protein